MPGFFLKLALYAKPHRHALDPDLIWPTIGQLKRNHQVLSDGQKPDQAAVLKDVAKRRPTDRRKRLFVILLPQMIYFPNPVVSGMRNSEPVNSRWTKYQG